MMKLQFMLIIKRIWVGTDEVEKYKVELTTASYTNYMLGIALKVIQRYCNDNNAVYMELLLYRNIYMKHIRID